MRRVLLILTTAVLLDAAPRTGSGQGLDIADMRQALTSYVLTEGTVRQFVALAEAARESPSSTPLAPPATQPSGTTTMAAMIATIESHPGLKALLAQHGLEASDFLLLPTAYMQAAILVTAPPEIVNQLAEASGANPANVALIRDRGAILTPLVERASKDLADAFPVR